MTTDTENDDQNNTESDVTSSEETTKQEVDNQNDQQNGDQDEPTDKQGSDDASESESKEGGVPEKYELTKPEDSLLNDDAIASVEAKAKELGLNNDQAQALLEAQNEAVSNFQQQAVDNWQKQQTEWIDSVKSDKELGGDNFDGTIKSARLALDKFADKAFVDTLNESGYGSHPELVRTFARIGNMLGEDSPLQGSENQGGKKRVADKFYGSSE